MVLKSVKFLLVTVSSFKERFVALAYGFELAWKSLQLVVILDICAFGTSNIGVELSRSATLSLLLTDELSLCFSEEVVTLVGIFTVFLEGTRLILIPALLGPCDFKLSARIFLLNCLVVKVIAETAHLLFQIVQLGGLRIGVRGRHEVVLLLLLALSSELEDLLMLLLFCLVVHRQLAFGVFDILLDEAALVLRSLDLIADSLNIHFSLVKRSFGIHDITVNCGAFLSEVRILTFQIFEFTLKNFGVACLLIYLLFIVWSQVANAVFHLVLSLSHFIDSEFQCLVHAVEVGAVLKLPSVGVDNWIVDALGAFDRCSRVRNSCHNSLRVFNSRSAGRSMPHFIGVTLYEILFTIRGSLMMRKPRLGWLVVLGFLKWRRRAPWSVLGRTDSLVKLLTTSCLIWNSIGSRFIQVSLNCRSMGRSTVFFVTVATGRIYKNLLTRASSGLLQNLLSLVIFRVQVRGNSTLASSTIIILLGWLVLLGISRSSILGLSTVLLIRWSGLCLFFLLFSLCIQRTCASTLVVLLIFISLRLRSTYVIVLLLDKTV